MSRLRSTRLARAVVAAGVLIVLAFVFRSALLRAWGRVLVVEDPLEPVDAIVVPQWTETAGALEAADLVARGVSPRVAVMVNDLDPSSQELIRRGLLNPAHTIWPVGLIKELGVADVEQIPGTEGTESEAEALPRWCDEHRYHSIIIVTTPDHSRRTRRVLSRTMRGHATKIIVHSSRYATFDPDRWWKTHEGIRIGIVELEKLLLDVGLHPLS